MFIVNHALRTLVICALFMTEYLTCKHLSEVANELSNVLSNFQFTSVQSKVMDSIVLFQDKYLKVGFSLRL